MKSLVILISLLPIALLAENQVSNTELSKKLDLILDKVSGLEKRISKLESENTAVRKDAPSNLDVNAARQLWCFLHKLRLSNGSYILPMDTPDSQLPVVWVGTG